ncbi:MAG: hypothetical protein LBV43_02170 [Prevotella sp.]|jgi:hypothetical protein|nr:hypothetical protein [Prevotella sp.]
MNEIKVSFFKGKFESKPSGKEIALLSTIIADKVESINRDNIEPFTRLVGKYGCTFCPATFKNGNKNRESFDQLQLFALDFDNNDPDNRVSFNEVKDRADKHDLPILFAYDTFNSVGNTRAM